MQPQRVSSCASQKMGHIARQRRVTSFPGLMKINLHQHLIPIYYTRIRNFMNMRPLLAELLQFENGIRTYATPYIIFSKIYCKKNLLQKLEVGRQASPPPFEAFASLKA